MWFVYRKSGMPLMHNDLCCVCVFVCAAIEAGRGSFDDVRDRDVRAAERQGESTVQARAGPTSNELRHAREASDGLLVTR